MPAPHLALALVNVIYVGVAGPASAPAGRELGALLTKEAHVDTINTTDRNRRKLVSAGSGGRELVKSLEAGGVVAGEIAGDDSPILRVVVYDGDADLKLQLDIPLAGDMSFDERGFEVVHKELLPVVLGLGRKAQPATGPPPDQTGDGGDTTAGHDAGDGGDQPSTPEATPADDETAAAAADESADDALARAAGMPGPLVTVTPGLHFIAAVGLGVMQRSFAPSPAAIPGYGSSAVGAVNLSGELRPERHIALEFLVERTLPMNTRLHGALLGTSIARWQFSAALRLPVRALALDGELGLGTRTFTIESKDPSRSPDGNYDYLVIGGRARRSLGRRVEAMLMLAFEPVLSGQQPTEKAFGSATRWAVDARASLRWLVTKPIVLEASAGWQRFQWSWPSAGGRSGGDASDDYFGASLGIGAAL